MLHPNFLEPQEGTWDTFHSGPGCAPCNPGSNVICHNVNCAPGVKWYTNHMSYRTTSKRQIHLLSSAQSLGSLELAQNGSFAFTLKDSIRDFNLANIRAKLVLTRSLEAKCVHRRILRVAALKELTLLPQYYLVILAPPLPQFLQEVACGI